MKPGDLRIIAGYFPNALAAVAEHCRRSNDKHNPGSEAHWAFLKSRGHVLKAIGHLSKAGQPDEGAPSHTIPGAWRALAALEEELILAGAEPGALVRLT